MARLFVTTPLLILATPLLFVGVGLLFVVQMINPPPSAIDKLIDRIIDA